MAEHAAEHSTTGNKPQDQDVTSSPEKSNCDGENRGPPENSKETSEEINQLIVDPSLPAYTDVIVIGAGPAGLMIAHELARHEIDVVILDHSRIEFDPADIPPDMKNPCPSQAALLQASTLDVLEDIGLINDVVAESRAIQRASVLLNGKPRFQVDRFEESKAARYQSGLICEQWKLERMLCDKLARQYATRVFRHHVAYRLVIKLDGDQSTSQESRASTQGKEAAGLVGDPSEYRVKALVKRINPLARRVVSDHEGKWIRAKWVVGADGVRSMTRRALETGSIPMGELTEYLVADVVVSEWDKESFFAKLNPGGCQNGEGAVPYGSVSGSEENSIFIIHCDLGSAMAFQFATDNHWRLMLLRSPAEDVQGDFDLRLDPGLNGFKKLDPPQDEEVADILRQLIPGTVVSEVKWKVAYAVQPRLASALVKERGIIIGDAARQEGPLWSAGLNAAIHDAVSLGWRLAAVIHRWGKYELLEAFSEERHANSEALMRWSIEHRDPLLSYSKVIQGPSLLQPVMSEKRLVQSLRSIVMVPEAIESMSSSMDTGLTVGACRALAFSANEDAPSKVLPLRFFVRDGCHALFLLVRVLPSGTKQRSVFGCERNEPAARWNETDVLNVAQLAKDTVKKLGVSHSGGFNKRPGVKVIWTLCLVTDAKDAGSQSLMSNNAYVKQIPQTLKEFMQSNPVLTTPAYTIVDHNNEIQQRSGVSFISKPQWISDVYRQLCGDVAAYVQESNQTAAFLLMRPDGRVAAMGYPGKPPGPDNLDDYLDTNFIPVESS